MDGCGHLPDAGTSEFGRYSCINSTEPSCSKLINSINISTCKSSQVTSAESRTAQPKAKSKRSTMVNNQQIVLPKVNFPVFKAGNQTTNYHNWMDMAKSFFKLFGIVSGHQPNPAGNVLLQNYDGEIHLADGTILEDGACDEPSPIYPLLDHEFARKFMPYVWQPAPVRQSGLIFSRANSQPNSGTSRANSASWPPYIR